MPIASSLPALNEIGHAIATTPYDVRIEGHTDDVPIHNAQYSDNWELSTARATELTRLFIEEDNIAASSTRPPPATHNIIRSPAILTEEGRSRNRRVDIIVLPTRQPPATMDRQFAKPTLQDYFLTSQSESASRLQEFLIASLPHQPALHNNAFVPPGSLSGSRSPHHRRSESEFACAQPGQSMQLLQNREQCRLLLQPRNGVEQRRPLGL